MKLLTGRFKQDGPALLWQGGHETLRVEAWGRDSLRVRSTRNASFKDLPGALLPQSGAKAIITITESEARCVNGNLTATVDHHGRICFLNTQSGRVLIEEPKTEILMPRGREYKSLGSDLHQTEVRFLPQADEAFYGMGQHRHGRLNQKGCVIDLAQRNCEITIPFLLSNRGYGFLWHNPGIGRAEFGETGTRWIADATAGVDYWVTAADHPHALMQRYAEATGHPPMLPAWAAGFWQSKLRYKTQDELLAVAREYKRRGLPLDVIVIDFFHWPRMGDLAFDPRYWPDPAAMMAELKELGIEAMISVWPSFNGDSTHFDEFQRDGLLLQTERGTPALFPFFDTQPDGLVYLHYYDPSNPEARRRFWEKTRKGYRRYGFKIYWLDACEPEMNPIDYDNLRFHCGNGREVACLYPLLHTQAFDEGMRGEGEEDYLFLCRSAWAGSQRYGAAVWSGDIKSTFEVLTAQVRAGLNMAVSGIPWWTTDIGGFHSGDPSTPYFRELIVRWFQYGVFCPLFRLHGVRQPAGDKGGADNEIWSFGEEAYEKISRLLHFREALKPYIMAQMKRAHDEGIPPMRPLWMDFPEDAQAWKVEDQFLFGPDILVAPVTTPGTIARDVYLPDGVEWVDAWTGKPLAAGKIHHLEAPLDRIPVCLRATAYSPWKTTFSAVVSE